ncbi:MotA/TolQ/ExbB proton channel family protein [Gayadomonas joobiniege]|uniref:MotA/TolQ/ExbB proton channel family protein n=1 Tax=Gayadomonas joobiniege TaxID=1234606 RepID=UPI00037DEC70|nr:MotA/TolQ/ExbB proton channel family protein [Gayadomonas joobiniege]
MWQLMLDNPLCWAMLLVAWLAYVLAVLQKLEGSDKPMIAQVLINALPLMGLLGTILGLQTSFVGMMTQGVDSQIVTAGIADALLTTQFGLVLAIPGWLLLSFFTKLQSENN